MIRLFKVKEKQKEEAQNANGRGNFKKQTAGELRVHKGYSFYVNISSNINVLPIYRCYQTEIVSD